MKLRHYLNYILLSSLTACSVLEDPNIVRADNSLATSATNNKITLKADGKDQTVVLARLPEKAGVVDVSFATTAGLFIHSNSSSIKELADSVSGDYRFARAVLQSDTLKKSEAQKQVFVTVEAGKTRDRLSLTFVK